MDERSDEQLLAAFRESGEMRHFEELVQRHIGRTRAAIYAMVLNDADADELTQEVFMRVSRSVQKFQGRSQFSTWLYRISMNTVHSFLRKKQRNRVDMVSDVPDWEVHDDMTPDRRAMSHEMGDAIGKALASLSDPLRAAITLTVLQNVSIKDAARIEGCMTATMYWRVHEARRILKEKLAC